MDNIIPILIIGLIATGVTVLIRYKAERAALRRSLFPIRLRHFVFYNFGKFQLYIKYRMFMTDKIMWVPRITIIIPGYPQNKVVRILKGWERCQK